MPEAGVAEIGLIQRCVSGDLDAFDQLVAAHGNWVYNLAYRITGDREEAADLAQEAFLRVWRALGKFKGGSSFSTWLHRVATNACLDELKRRRRRPLPLSALAGHQEALPQHDLPDPAEDLERRERQAAVQRAISKLPPDQRVVVTLCDLQGMSYQEAAWTVGAKVGTLKSRLNRARLALRQSLASELELFRDGDSQT